jgi:hypothetical protein
MQEYFGELMPDKYGMLWVKLQPVSFYNLIAPPNEVVWHVPVLETGAANDDTL